MPILLYRIDERLIHGQVVVGWGSQLHLEHYIVVDETLVMSDWERELYILGLPEHTTAQFASVVQAREEIDRWRSDERKEALLTRNLETMVALARDGVLRGEKVNLGGLHAREGREQVLPFLYLSPQERELLRALANEGVRVTARDLPGAPETSLEELLE